MDGWPCGCGRVNRKTLSACLNCRTPKGLPAVRETAEGYHPEAVREYYYARLRMLCVQLEREGYQAPWSARSYPMPRSREGADDLLRDVEDAVRREGERRAPAAR